MLKSVKAVSAVRKAAEAARKAKKRIALVPTMGALHEGHLALIRKARKVADFVVVSIFVNPTQFGPGEDFKAYPRDLKGDLVKCKKARVNLVFNPPASELYGKDFATYVVQEQYTEKLCGLSRPGHFRGVLTVVMKLLNIVQPDTAVFGQKDYQQLICIKKMVDDLGLTVKIVSGATVREQDGLAVSSRNEYLDPIARRNAVCLYRALLSIKSGHRRGEKRLSVLLRRAREVIEATPQASIDYLTIVDKETLNELRSLKKGGVAMGAVYLDGTRLIDNLIL